MMSKMAIITLGKLKNAIEREYLYFEKFLNEVEKLPLEEKREVLKAFEKLSEDTSIGERYAALCDRVVELQMEVDLEEKREEES